MSYSEDQVLDIWWWLRRTHPQRGDDWRYAGHLTWRSNDKFASVIDGVLTISRLVEVAKVKVDLIVK
jgi:hypothetical protein